MSKVSNTKNSKANAKKSAVLTAEQFENRLKKRSQWWNSIQNPLEGAGARVPDPIGWRTSTYQMVKRFSLPLNAGGCAGLRVMSPVPCNNTGDSLNLIGNYQVITAGGIVTNLAWGSLGGNVIGSSFFDEVNTALCAGANSLADVIRPVSGGVYATYTGTALSNAGTIVSYTNPGGFESSNSSDTRFRSLATASVMPVKSNSVAIAKLLPMIRNIAPGPSYGGGMWDYRTFYPASFTRGGSDTPPTQELGVYLTGGTPSTGSLDILVVFNYEFKQRLNSGLIPSLPSPIDPMEEAFVLGALDNDDATGTCSLKQYATAPSDSRVTQAEKQEESGPLASLTNAVGFLGPILEVGLPLLASVL